MMIHKIVLLILPLITGPLVAHAFAPLTATQQKTTTTTELRANLVDRRSVFSTAAGAAATLIVSTAGNKVSYALDRYPADNEIIKEQNQVTDKLDINNAPLANYMKLPGKFKGTHFRWICSVVYQHKLILSCPSPFAFRISYCTPLQ